jgi:hypothetical protein
MAHNKKQTHTKRDWLLNSDKYSIMHLEGAYGWRIQIYYVQSTNTDIHTYMLSYTVKEERYMSVFWTEHGETAFKFLRTSIGVNLTYPPLCRRVFYRTHRIFLDFFHRPVFQKTRRFGNWICFRPQVKVGNKTPTHSQLGPLERANLKRRVFWNTGRWEKSRKIL